MTFLYGISSQIIMKGVDSFDKLVSGCGLLDSLEDIWDIFVNTGIWL